MVAALKRYVHPREWRARRDSNAGDIGGHPSFGSRILCRAICDNRMAGPHQRPLPGDIMRKSSLDSVSLSEGDRVEPIVIAAGG
jgi:hypothetical protein